jgi:hypothetical protein
VGFPAAKDGKGIVLVFNQNTAGGCEQLASPFMFNADNDLGKFGKHVAIDGDIACVMNESPYYNTQLFLRQDNKWVQSNAFGSDEWIFGCSISGDTIAIGDNDQDHDEYIAKIKLYKYNRELNEISPIQDPIVPTGGFSSFALTKDYLVYVNKNGKDILVYGYNDPDQVLSFKEQFHVDDLRDSLAFAVSDDVIVVGGDQTHIFTLHDTNWTELATLNQECTFAAVSGQHFLTASSNEVHAYKIQQHCLPEIGT